MMTVEILIIGIGTFVFETLRRRPAALPEVRLENISAGMYRSS
jgi:hypothetical protein